jgi:transposase
MFRHASLVQASNQEATAHMITLGLDPHPASHTVMALDESGVSQGHLTVPNTEEGLMRLHEFSARLEPRRWAVEGAGNHFISMFVGQLLSRGDRVFSIPPSLTSQYRARRGRKKNDIIDAGNVARALLANPQLPELKVVEQQRTLQELTRTQRRLSEQLKATRGAQQELASESPVREVLQRLIETLASEVKKLEQRIREMVRKIMPSLLEIPGVGPVVAGVLLAETAGPKRFATADHFASYCGAAPVERGSGQNSRVQVNPGGNRRLNWALHIVAMVRLRTDGGRSRAFLDNVKSSGKTQRAALRVLKTYIARELFRAMRNAIA